MTAFTFPKWTRVYVCDTVNNLELPTVAELNAGTNIGPDLLLDGLQIERDQQVDDATPWRGPAERTRPTRYSYSPSELLGLRHLQGGSEALWTAAAYKDTGVLVVRYGVSAAAAWAASQVVETFAFTWGKRSVISSSSGVVTFRVPLHISEDHDDAVVAA